MIGVLEFNPELDSIRVLRERARSALFSRVLLLLGPQVILFHFYLQTICLTCLYKIDNFNENVISILGAKPSLLSSLHLWLINPALLAVVVGLSIFTPYQSFVWWLILLLLTTVGII